MPSGVWRVKASSRRITTGKIIGGVKGCAVAGKKAYGFAKYKL